MTERTMQEKFKESGLTLSEIADGTGISKAAASLIVNDKYKGKDDLKRRVEAYLDVFIKAVPKGNNGFEPTPGQKRAKILLDFLRSKRRFGLIVGPSGIGKTTLLEEYRRENQDVTVLPVRWGQSMGGMLSALCGQWGLPEHGTIDSKWNRLCKIAKGRFLCVDEADNLTRGKTEKQILRMVDVFRNFYDAGAGVALVGLSSLYEDICRAGETYVFSRIRYMNSVEPPDPKVLSRFWESAAAGLELSDKQKAEIVSKACRSGYFRYLNELADAAAEFGDLDAALGMMFSADRKPE